MPRESTQKIAIQRNEDVLTFLNAAKTLTDQVRAFCLVNYGSHPENLRGWKNGKHITIGENTGIIEYKRAKNAKPMTFIIPKHHAEAIASVVRRGRLNVSNRRYEQICGYMGESVPDYLTPPVSPWTMRHTFILNSLKRHLNHPNCMNLVAIEAGCTVETVARNYLTMNEWIAAGLPQNRDPLDLSAFKFMEVIL
jgi:hypothetical protein